MESSGILRSVALIGTYISEELSATIIRVTRIAEVRTTLSVTNNWRTLCRLLVTDDVVLSSPIHVNLMMLALSSSETSVLTRATLRNIPEDAILHSHRREILKSYIVTFCPKFRNEIVRSLLIFVNEIFPPKGNKQQFYSAFVSWI
jgi:hypothetical protein